MQLGINNMSEWLLIEQGEAEYNYTIHECAQSNIVQENLTNLIAHYKKYEHVWSYSTTLEPYGCHGLDWSYFFCVPGLY